MRIAMPGHRIQRLLTATAIAVTTAGAVAAAEPLTQSMPLSEVLARTRSSPQVSLQVRLQLTRAKLKRDDVVCRAQVMDRTWAKLGGSVLGPYECPIGPRTLVLTAKPNFTDASGTKVRRSDPEVKQRAVSTRETRFQWRWKKA
jgi:hypothetical protein